jgi:hypothetical protein
VRRAPPRETPAAAPAIKRRWWGQRGWLVAAAALLTLLGGLGVTEATGVTQVRGTVIRLLSPEGTLEVRVDDPAVSVQIDGEDLVITGAGAKEIRLKPGRYTVEGRKDGQVVSRELVTVTKDNKQVVRVSLEPERKGPEEKTLATPTTDADRRAAEYVLSIGGTVRVNGQTRDLKAAADLPREPFRLTLVELADNKQVTDMGLAQFKGCKDLTGLSLARTETGLWSDEGLVYFKDCKGLTGLDLRVTNVGDAGVAHFKDCKNLTLLDLRNTRVTDAGLAYFEGCKGLTVLNLGSAVRVSDAGVAHFKDCKALTTLSLGYTKVSDAGLIHFKDCNGLTALRLDSTQVGNAGLAHFENCTKLTYLTLKQTKVTAAKIEELKKALPKCKIEWDGGVIEPK